MEKLIQAEDISAMGNVFGEYDENIKLIENEFNVNVVTRESKIKISGDNEESISEAQKVIEGLFRLAKRGETVNKQIVSYFISLAKEGNEALFDEIGGDCVCITAKGKPIKPKTFGQKEYIKSIRENSITFGVGPAGTGKTYLAVAMAVTSKQNSNHPSRGRGRRKTRISPRRSPKQSGPLFTAALRRSFRYARDRDISKIR